MDEELTLAAELFVGAFPVLHCRPSERQVHLKIKQGLELNRWFSTHHSVYDRKPPALRLHNPHDDLDIYKDWLEVDFSSNDKGIGSLVSNVHLLPPMTMTELELLALDRFEVMAQWPSALTPPRRRQLGRKLAECPRHA
jgi:hypothetical protein